MLKDMDLSVKVKEHLETVRQTDDLVEQCEYGAKMVLQHTNMIMDL